MCYRLAEVIMSNPNYQIVGHDGEFVVVREHFDFTDPNCPGIPMRAGKRIEDATHGYCDIRMERRLAINLGLLTH
jgi:hypothetical protein